MYIFCCAVQCIFLLCFHIYVKNIMFVVRDVFLFPGEMRTFSFVIYASIMSEFSYFHPRVGFYLFYMSLLLCVCGVFIYLHLFP